MTKTILLFVVAAVLVVGAIVLVNSQSQTTAPPPQKTSTAPVVTREPSPKVSTDEAMMGADKMIGKEVNVNATSAGFEPKDLTIKMGTKVVWVNDGTSVANVSSALHPTHQVYPTLNLGNFESGESVELVFDKAGTYRYHNHLNPSQTGTVTVTQ